MLRDCWSLWVLYVYSVGFVCHLCSSAPLGTHFLLVLANILLGVIAVCTQTIREGHTLGNSTHRYLVVDLDMIFINCLKCLSMHLVVTDNPHNDLIPVSLIPEDPLGLSLVHVGSMRDQTLGLSLVRQAVVFYTLTFVVFV